MENSFAEQHAVLCAPHREAFVIVEVCGQAEMCAHVSCQNGSNNNLADLLQSLPHIKSNRLKLCKPESHFS